ncbi:FAD-binding protein, partial [Siminovitchia fortis]|uniref:FAD-binding protein n=1 Tax=Siminovitchia fortis TaxID=254758 RepID=UPI001C92C337
RAEMKDMGTVMKEMGKKGGRGVELWEGKVVVSGGRGVKGGEGLELVEELGEVLGGGVGGWGGGCDAEYCD